MSDTVAARVPIEVQIAEAERELKKREMVYPRWIANGKMTEHDAKHRLMCQRAIIETLRRFAHAEDSLGRSLGSQP
jgi:hypothetical protein